MKNEIKNWVNFRASRQRSENLHFDWILLPKAYKDLDEKIQKSYVSWHWRVSKVWRKPTLVSKDDMRNLVNFNVMSKSESLYFDVLLFSIAYEVSAKKVQKNDLSWQWKKIQAFKKNWLFVWKMTWEIWRTVTRVAESRKICTLMGYFSRRYVMFELKKHRGTVWKMTYIWFQKWHE